VNGILPVRGRPPRCGFVRSIASCIPAVDDVCRAAAELLAREGLSDRRFEVDLLLREFVNNAIVHGNRLDVRRRVEVQVRIGRRYITLRVTDEGPGFRWRARRRCLPGETSPSGWGFAIGAMYAQRISRNRAGNRVEIRVVKHPVAPEQQESAPMTGHEISRDGGTVEVRLRGKLTAVEVPALQGTLKQELHSGGTEVVFDLADVASVDSTGIGLLIAANNSLSAVNGSIRLRNVPPDILRLLGSMRLVDRLHASAAQEPANG
jgi:serine/threonine-protein kinase RsbW